MKIAAFALLLSGVLTATLAPIATVSAGDWNQPGRPARGWSTGNISSNDQIRQSVVRTSEVSGWSTSLPAQYHFRPWSAERQSAGYPQPAPLQRQAAMVNHSPVWSRRPLNTGFTRIPSPHYRFRPLPAGEPHPPVAPQAVTYRTTNISIPNHYVYRPLNPVKKIQTRPATPKWPPRYSQALPAAPRYGYPYRPMMMAPSALDRHAMTPPALRSAQQRPNPRYVYGGNYFSGLRYRPDNRGYTSARYDWPGYGLAREPGNGFSRGPGHLRFRPVPGFPALPAYAYAPGVLPPTMAYRPAMARQDYRPHKPYHYPDRRGMSDASAATYNDRINWYDGRTDGDGAWYKLTEQREWPRVSQNWPGSGEFYSTDPPE
jgi:hypothetical protein